MRHLLLIVSFLIITTSLPAQQSNLLSISSEGSVDLPADIIQFNININAEADSPKEAYSLHQKREKALVQLLDQYQVEEKDIHFEPISIYKSNNSGRYSENQETTYQTRQAVSLKLTDFGIYEEIQVALIEENFDNFNGNFLSSKAEQGKDSALTKAIKMAKEKAKLIANEAGVKLGNISNINYGHSFRPSNESFTVQLRGTSSENLMKYNQVVTITANISIEFAIIN